jgi:hypothetical protein
MRQRLRFFFNRGKILAFFLDNTAEEPAVPMTVTGVKVTKLGYQNEDTFAWEYAVPCPSSTGEKQPGSSA